MIYTERFETETIFFVPSNNLNAELIGPLILLPIGNKSGPLLLFVATSTLDNNWFLTLEDGTRTSDSSHFEVFSVSVVIDDLPDWSESTTGSFLEFNTGEGLAWLSVVLGIPGDQDNSLAISSSLNSYCLRVDQTIITERVPVLQVIWFPAERLLASFEQETGVIPDDHPLKMCRHFGDLEWRSRHSTAGFN
jgi:hypothetical protein